MNRWKRGDKGHQQEEEEERKEELLFENLTPREDCGEEIDRYLMSIGKRMMRYRLNVFLL